jgi:hypothetical protein
MSAISAEFLDLDRVCRSVDVKDDVFVRLFELQLLILGHAVVVNGRMAKV